MSLSLSLRVERSGPPALVGLVRRVEGNFELERGGGHASRGPSIRSRSRIPSLANHRRMQAGEFSLALFFRCGFSPPVTQDRTYLLGPVDLCACGNEAKESDPDKELVREGGRRVPRRTPAAGFGGGGTKRGSGGGLVPFRKPSSESSNSSNLSQESSSFLSGGVGPAGGTEAGGGAEGTGHRAMLTFNPGRARDSHSLGIITAFSGPRMSYWALMSCSRNSSIPGASGQDWEMSIARD